MRVSKIKPESLYPRFVLYAPDGAVAGVCVYHWDCTHTLRFMTNAIASVVLPELCQFPFLQIEALKNQCCTLKGHTTMQVDAQAAPRVWLDYRAGHVERYLQDVGTWVRA